MNTILTEHIQSLFSSSLEEQHHPFLEAVIKSKQKLLLIDQLEEALQFLSVTRVGLNLLFFQFPGIAYFGYFFSIWFFDYAKTQFNWLDRLGFFAPGALYDNLAIVVVGIPAIFLSTLSIFPVFALGLELVFFPYIIYKKPQEAAFILGYTTVIGLLSAF